MTKETVSQKPIWFGRGLIVVLLILIPVVKYGGFEISRAETGGAIVYTAPIFFSVFSVVMSGFAALAAAYFWSARKTHPVFPWVALVFIAVGIYGLVMAPTTLLSRLTLTANSFEVRSGHWFRPVTTKVEIPKLVYMAVEETEAGRYRLVTYDGDGNDTSFPIGDLLKAALPEVLERAGAHDVLIADGPDGGLMPAELMP